MSTPPPQQQQQRTTRPPATSLFARLSRLASTLQFAWFVGHAVTVIQSASYLLFGQFGGGARTYASIFWATLVSYSVILYKAHGRPQFNQAYFQRAWMDENTQYLLLALIWLTSKPVLVVILPFTIFSVLHTANFLRTDVLPTLFPSSSPLHQTIVTRVSPALLQFTQKYQEPGVRLVSYLEVWAIMPLLVVFVFTGGVSLFTPFLYATFLRHRFYTSVVTREAVARLKDRLDGVFLAPNMPPWVKGVYQKAVELVVQFGESAVRRQPAPQR